MISDPLIKIFGKEMHLSKKLLNTGRIIWKIVNSKILVIITLLCILIGGSVKIFNSAEASDNYKFGTVYQYFLLDGRGETLADKSSSEKILKVGNLGNAGVQGSFSYGSIIDNGKDNNNKEVAENFVSMMATYSKFNYFSVQNQGFNIIISVVGRFLLGILLLIGGFLYDIFSSVIFAIPTLIAKFTLIPLLSSWITNTHVGNDTLGGMLSNILGVNTSAAQGILSLSMSALGISILLAIFQYLKGGSKHANRRGRNKLIGRLLSIPGILIALAVAGEITNVVYQLNQDDSGVDKSTNIYQDRVVDDENWAKRFNFAPTGNSRADGNFNGDPKNGYVDNKYAPYGNTSASDRIKDINSTSPYYKQAFFANSAVALRYMFSDTFTADQYIQYEGTEASVGTYGSYYEYANNFAKFPSKSAPYILDTKKNYYSSYSGSGSPVIRNETAEEDWNFKKAIDDYKDKDSLKMSAAQAWRERFIYGTKSTGSKLEAYYSNTPPSSEQVVNAVGTGSENSMSLSDQTMYLVLSTKFNSSGGEYYIAGPARGLINTGGLFDSSRVAYYSFSLIGIPFVSVIGVLGDIMITLLLWLVAVMAVLAVGLIEMNVKPLTTAGKWMFIGDLEYGMAFMIYVTGATMTMVTFGVITRLMTDISRYVPNLISSTLSVLYKGSSDYSNMTGEGALALGSLSPVSSIVFALILWYAVKNDVKGARSSLMYAFVYPWEVAREYARRYERQATGGSMAEKGAKRWKADRGGMKLARMLGTKIGMKEQTMGTYDDLANDIRSDAKRLSNIPLKFRPFDTNQQEEKPLSAEEAKRKQALYGIAEDMMDIPEFDSDSEAGQLRDDAMRDLETFNVDPTKENYDNAKQSLQLLLDNLEKNGASADSIAKVEDAIATLNRDSEFGEIPAEEIQTRDLARDIDNTIQDINLSKVPGGEKLRSAARNALAEFAVEPNDNNLAKSIENIESLREALYSNGVPEEELAAIDAQLEKLHSLQQPTIDVEAQLSPNALSDMDDQLVDMDVSGVVNGDRLKEEAREALANFKDVPTQKNLETAINSLEKLRDSDLGRSEIQKLDGQLNSLRSLNDPMLNVAAKIPGGIDGIENVISDPAHIAGITNGTKLRDDIRDSLNDLRISPSIDSIDSSIANIKKLRDSVGSAGGSTESLDALNKQIEKLESARRPEINFKGAVDQIEGLSEPAKKQLQEELNKVSVHPTNIDYSNVRKVINNANETLKNPDDIKILGNVKTKLDQAEVGAIRDNIQSIVGDSKSVSVPKVQNMIGKITDYQLDGSPEKLLAAKKGINEVRSEAYKNGDHSLGDELGKRLDRLNHSGVIQQVQQVSDQIAKTPVNNKVSEDIKRTLNDYSNIPTQKNFSELKKAFSEAIIESNIDGDNATNKLLRQQLKVLKNTNANYLDGNFANEVRESLGDVAKNNNIQALLYKLSTVDGTNSKLDITKQITTKVKELGMTDKINSARMVKAIQGIKEKTSQ